jgi:hypothetical protein
VPGLRAALAKLEETWVTQSKSLLGARTVSGTGAPPKTVASALASVSKVAMTVTSLRVGVLKIGAGAKRPGMAPSLAPKGKQVRLDVGPPLSSVWP